ncbi:GTP-binding protein [Saccharopolyspora endophytica]|uniref:ATP/GTP-binding protein n=1 Tax=Saccharopolyspora endophytica TaxID=543886 RepID=A0ABS5DA24_9PSEU|nr:ATP/GTP-binding protein [Saccharopolyspora endophytica]MBQ0923102.1 ATP/GTP-binding protein [Saccharopolyspora endophytica]
MVSSSSKPSPFAVKILIAGGFGVGKTTFVKTVSETTALSTEATLTEASCDVDDLAGIEDKTTTTVAFDFGRFTVDDQVTVYMFGTPGQDRFWFMWDEIAEGALGAIILADARRIHESFAAIDYFENREIPFIIAVNHFAGAAEYKIEELQYALDIPPRIPTIIGDARDRESCKYMLVTLVDSLIDASTSSATPWPSPLTHAP